MQSWYEIYRDRMNKRYFEHVKEKYKFFIDTILEHGSTRYFELGCGAGNITKALRERDPFISQHVLVDYCPKMLSLAVENNPVIDCTFKVLDITRHQSLAKHDFSNLVHSHGVLEHFENADILRICKEADRYAGVQVHYVPGAKYEVPSRGDERLMTSAQWEDILGFVKKELGRGVKTSVLEFNSGYDLALIIKREFL